jgi:hypothetical protein
MSKLSEEIHCLKPLVLKILLIGYGFTFMANFIFASIYAYSHIFGDGSLQYEQSITGILGDMVVYLVVCCLSYNIYSIQKAYAERLSCKDKKDV